MMLYLPMNVGARALQLRDTDGESAVVFLPGEPGQLRTNLMHPLGRAALDELYRFRDRKGGRGREQQVNVVFRPSRGETGHPVGPGDTPEVREELGLQLGMDELPALFGAEHAMDEDLRVR